MLDGRDIGTVVCPDADVKLYVTASAEVRARRRLASSRARGEADFADVLADIAARDAARHRAARLPAEAAADAHLLDTTEMDIEPRFMAARAIIEAAIGQASA